MEDFVLSLLINVTALLPQVGTELIAIKPFALTLPANTEVFALDPIFAIVPNLVTVVLNANTKLTSVLTTLDLAIL